MLTLPDRFPPVPFTHPDVVVFGPYRDLFGPVTSVRVRLPNGYSLSLTHGGGERDPGTVLTRAGAPTGVAVPEIGTPDDLRCLPSATGDQVAAVLESLAALDVPPVYIVPPLTRSQVGGAVNRRPTDCGTCHQEGGYPVPHWPRPRACNSSFAKDIHGVERLTRVHCTCDWCF